MSYLSVLKRRRIMLLSAIDPLAPFASYPLYNDSNEIIGTTVGIDGVDTNVIYSGSDVKINGGGSYIDIPHNDIFSFTDGFGNDKPFTISFTANFEFLELGNTVVLVGKRETGVGGEWSALIYLGDITFVVRDSLGGYIQLIFPYIPPLNTDIDFVFAYDGSNSENGINVKINGILQTGTRVESNYTGIQTTGDEINIGAYGWSKQNPSSRFFMKDLKFYNYEKLT